MSVALCITVVSLFSLCSTDAGSVCSAFVSSISRLCIYAPFSNLSHFSFLIGLDVFIFVVVVPSASSSLAL